MTVGILEDKIFSSRLNSSDSRYTRPLELELESVNMGIAKAREELIKAKQSGSYSTSKAGSVLVYQLMQPLAKALVDFIQNNINSASAKDRELIQLLQDVKIDKASFIILRNILNAVASKESVRLTLLSDPITKHLLDE